MRYLNVRKWKSCAKHEMLPATAVIVFLGAVGAFSAKFLSFKEGQRRGNRKAYLV